MKKETPEQFRRAVREIVEHHLDDQVAGVRRAFEILGDVEPSELPEVVRDDFRWARSEFESLDEENAHQIVGRLAFLQASLCTVGAEEGPEIVDVLIRDVVNKCWNLLPEERQSVDEVERIINGFVQRALRDFRQGKDAEASGGDP